MKVKEEASSFGNKRVPPNEQKHISAYSHIGKEG